MVRIDDLVALLEVADVLDLDLLDVYLGDLF
jgi:hypothetical protein